MTAAKKVVSFPREIWETLSEINVTKYVEKKMNLNYLSWASAWALLMSEYPESVYEFCDNIAYADMSVEVSCVVTVTDGDKAFSRKMWLPVMDHKNNAIKNPDSRKISDTRMRCLVKCMAMFGLGHALYTGEELPEAPKDEVKTLLLTADQVEAIMGAHKKSLYESQSLDMLKSKYEIAIKYLRSHKAISAEMKPKLVSILERYKDESKDNLLKKEAEEQAIIDSKHSKT